MYSFKEKTSDDKKRKCSHTALKKIKLTSQVLSVFHYYYQIKCTDNKSE